MAITVKSMKSSLKRERQGIWYSKSCKWVQGRGVQNPATQTINGSLQTGQPGWRQAQGPGYNQVANKILNQIHYTITSGIIIILCPR